VDIMRKLTRNARFLAAALALFAVSATAAGCSTITKYTASAPDTPVTAAPPATTTSQNSINAAVSTMDHGKPSPASGSAAGS
jgi:uncharacterized protein YceK